MIDPITEYILLKENLELKTWTKFQKHPIWKQFRKDVYTDLSNRMNCDGKKDKAKRMCWYSYYIKAGEAELKVVSKFGKKICKDSFPKEKDKDRLQMCLRKIVPELIHNAKYDIQQAKKNRKEYG